MKRGPYGKNKVLFERHNEEICSLRKQGFGYGTIAKRLNVPIHLVISWTKDVRIYTGDCITQSSIQKENWMYCYQNSSWDELSKNGKRFRVLQEQNGACLWCKLIEWRGFPIPLEWDHINGDNKNETRENVRFLCGNCHSQTETFSGRNKKFTRNKYGKFPRKLESWQPKYKRIRKEL